MSRPLSVVVITFNEEANIGRTLKNVEGLVRDLTGEIIVVDSGSTDDSAAMARTMGAEVVELDMSMPFTAARARNEGFRRLRELAPNAKYVQFVDGDCEFSPGW